MNKWSGLFAATMVGGLAGAAAGRFSTGPGEDPTRARGESGRESQTDDAVKKRGGAQSEDASLPQKIAALERRVSLLTAALARGDSSLAEGVEDENRDILDEVDVADPVFEAAVLDIMDRETGRKESERESRRTALRAERGRRFSSELGEKLELDVEQQEEIAQVVTDHFARFRELRNDESPDRPVTRRDFQARIEAINKEALEKLEEVMTPVQFERYQALDPADQIGFGWGRGRNTAAPAGSARPERE